MKVLLVSDYGTATGGAEIVLLELRDELRRRGHDVRLFSSSAQPLPNTAIEADATGFGTVTRWRTLVQCGNPAAALSLKREIKQFRPSVVHVRSYLTQLSPLILPLLRDVPAVLHVLDYRAVCPRSTKQLPDGSACRVDAGRACLHSACVPLRDWPALEVQRRLDRRWRGAFDRVVANSRWVEARLRALGISIDETIWNGVPVCAGSVERAPAPTITFAGRIVQEKGVDYLLKAFAVVLQKFRDASLVVAGGGTDLPQAQKLADDLGVSGSVAFLGHVDRSVLGAQLAGGWVHVVPSTWEEPYGRSAAEALMRGQALVTSAVGGLGELADASGGAVTVPPGDVDALAAELVRLLDEPAEIDRLGLAGREFALRELAIERFADRFIDAYSRAGVVDVR